MVRTASARSRDDLRRGLFVSGAMHLALLYVVLHLPHGSEDVLIRSYANPVDVFRENVVERPVPPPIAPAEGAARASKTGVITPTIQRPKLTLPDDFTGFGAGPAPSGVKGGGETGPGPGNPTAPPDDPGRVFRINEVEVVPVPTYAPKPPYPEIARDNTVTGRVVLQVLVRVDGSVGQVRVVSGTRLLADSAQETLYRWRFQPARANGRPVAVWVEIPVVFTL